MESVMVRYKDLDLSNVKWWTDFCVDVPVKNRNLIVGFQMLDNTGDVEDLVYYAYDPVKSREHYKEAEFAEDITYDVGFGEDHDTVIEALMSLFGVEA